MYLVKTPDPRFLLNSALATPVDKDFKEDWYNPVNGHYAALPLDRQARILEGYPY